MKTKSILFIIVGLIILGGVFAFWSVVLKNNTPPAGGGSGQGHGEITVFKSPTCGCCGEYITYLKRQGFQVKVENVQDTLSIKEKYRVPQNLESCHTAVAGNYFIEGHVPVEAINKLLSEKPDILGIALPGMPSGSPGMGGAKTGPFLIQALSKEGSVKEFTAI